MNDSDLQSELELYDGPDDPSQIAAGLVLFLGFPLPFIKFACPEYLPISLYINPKHLLRFPPRPQHHLQTYQRNRGGTPNMILLTTFRSCPLLGGLVGSSKTLRGNDSYPLCTW